MNSKNEARIKELEAEIARLKFIPSVEPISYAEKLIHFIKTKPRLMYLKYGDVKTSNIYEEGRSKGREDVIRDIESFIRMHGDGGKL